MKDTMVGLYVVKQDASSKPKGTGIVLKGQVVFNDLGNTALAAAMLFGLMYAFNLNYPPEMKYCFEVLQKIVMALDGNTLTKKARALKNRQYE
ncbi:uncharacterized protein AKAME5_002607800 [Lates japonicus]|uniref:Uncharacterized protein n=1 Tax=Lates japonicus TaxID=270547 RepID=A0AAD3RNC1_LATJO|nr:uncharacterized protein AKAME5_002607800 [Lates japonicus]